MLLTAVFILTTFGTFGWANPIARNMVVHDSRASAPAGYVATEPTPGDQVLNLRIALAQSNASGLEQRLLEVSDPAHADFRQWLSKEEVENFVRPTQDTVTAVSQWLSDNGISSRILTPAGDWIEFSVPASKANDMLDTQFTTYTHANSGQPSVRTLSYSIPVALKEHIQLIHPTTSFTAVTRGSPVASFSRPVTSKAQTDAVIADATTVPASCNSSMTPACLQALYSIPSSVKVNKQNKLGVAGMGDEFANQADLTAFLKQFRPDMNPNTNFSTTSVDGGTNDQTAYEAGYEANLDIQYTVGIATDIPTVFVSVGTNYKDGQDQGFLDVINALIAESAPPQVFTTSYGFEKESDLSQSLTTTMCNSYMQLSARGVSILFASGDGGVAASPGEACTAKSFLPTFPTCPYATLVGATENVNPERGAELSAGGFSNYFSQPSWQASAVSSYLTKLGSEYSGAYNKAGRAYPDVSAQGNRVEMIWNDFNLQMAGTSCSSPIFSSVIAMLNNELLNAGKPVLGFLNPWLYANPQAFNDITTGNNPGCDTNGFPAAAGWDPVTGLGTPNYAAMRTAAGLS
ncbi:family S53 protease [Punctularia strigosozonata HHB-11173 SS5]|uniref:family S53 protease n=1 Tax=Punctularia strigosozonata (strain HHB-11173) TaxID=741275 RepID=UPI0004418681|nr:family S53 protease [Punctularia strigosozonata HHB-11173 SS5]EIN06456.1 family S53 protease [Punctularia strigosozonata HHB-11173 SS5]